MPISWRYLIASFLKVFFLCVATFIAVLLTTRLDEVARFLTMGPEGKLIVEFILLQIPYILPIAIPISALISSILLVQRLSQTHELTAMRASGFGLRDILAPVLLTALFLSFANFYIVSELATSSHLKTALFKVELRSVNPLLLLHNKHLMKVKGIYFDTFGHSRIGETADDVIIALPGTQGKRANILVAKNIEASPTKFLGKNVTLITSLATKKEGQFDHLLVENMESSQTPIEDFAKILEKKTWSLNNDHLQLSHLLIRIKEAKEEQKQARDSQQRISEIKQMQRNINRGYAEIMRRISLSLAVLTFTFMGLSFGISISRNRSNRSVLYVVLLASFLIITFFAAKSVDHLFITAALMYLTPHLLIICLSIWRLNRITRGIE